MELQLPHSQELEVKHELPNSWESGMGCGVEEGMETSVLWWFGGILRRRGSPPSEDTQTPRVSGD